MSEKTKTFADRLRSLREAAGISQYALAQRSGLTKQALSRLELGEREPTWETVQLLAVALGVDCREFVDPTVRPPADAPEPKPRGRPRKAEPAPEPADKPGPKKQRKRKSG